MSDGEGDNSPSGLTEWTEVCFHCRYDLRGSAGAICPECGRRIHRRIIRFRAPPLLHSAAASLADNGIPFKVIDDLAASAGFTIWAGGQLNSTLAALIISQEDYPQARRIIAELAAAGPRPLVDRHEPICPRCGEQLDPRTDESCAKCGCLIEWIDVQAVAHEDSADHRAQGDGDAPGLTRPRLLMVLLFVPVALLAGLFFAASMKWFLGPEGLLFAMLMAIGLFVVCTLACGLRRKYMQEPGEDEQPVDPPVRPIVDRGEPVCPRCSAELDVNGPELCPACGSPFRWVEIDVPDIDPTGKHCRYCYYDLTGNTSRCCPECGETIECDPCDLVEAATQSLEPVEEDTEPATTLWQDVAPLLAILLGVILGSVLAGYLGHALKLRDPGMIVFNGWLILIVSALVVVEFNLRRRAMKARKRRVDQNRELRETAESVKPANAPSEVTHLPSHKNIDKELAATFRTAVKQGASARESVNRPPIRMPFKAVAFLSVALVVIVVVALVGLLEVLVELWFPALEWLLVVAGFAACTWLVHRYVRDREQRRDDS